ncbi:MAG: hypothetical protein WD509_02300 [Candidatus Paceibacterota bacterium]
MIQRVFFTILFFLSAFLFPWYITIFLGIVLLAVAPGYEVILGGLVLDFIYGAVVPSFFTSPFSFTLFFALLYSISYVVKGRLVFYKDAQR